MQEQETKQKKVWENSRSLDPSSSSLRSRRWKEAHYLLVKMMVGGMDGGSRPNGFVMWFGPR